MSESATQSTLPLTEKAFGLETGMIAEMQKVLCKNYDEASKSRENFSSAQVWSAMMAYIEAGLGDESAAKLAHKIQRVVLRGGLNQKAAEDTLKALDEAIETKDKRDLAAGMGMFFAANMKTDNEMLDFSNKATVDMEVLLASQGI